MLIGKLGEKVDFSWEDSQQAKRMLREERQWRAAHNITDDEYKVGVRSAIASELSDNNDGMKDLGSNRSYFERRAKVIMDANNLSPWERRQILRKASREIEDLPREQQVFVADELKKAREERNEILGAVGKTALAMLACEAISYGAGQIAGNVDVLQNVQNIPALALAAGGTYVVMWRYITVPQWIENLNLLRKKRFSMDLGGTLGLEISKRFTDNKLKQEQSSKRAYIARQALTELIYFGTAVAPIREHLDKLAENLDKVTISASFFITANIATLGASYLKTHGSAYLRTKDPKAWLPHRLQSPMQEQ